MREHGGCAKRRLLIPAAILAALAGLAIRLPAQSDNSATNQSQTQKEIPSPFPFKPPAGEGKTEIPSPYPFKPPAGEGKTESPDITRPGVPPPPPPAGEGKTDSPDILSPGSSANSLEAQPAGPAGEVPRISIGVIRQAPPPPTTAADWHVIKRFDFDEAKLGNEGDVPMYWFRFKGADYPDFPRYATGTWDRTFGYRSRESFRLEANGGNVGFYYQTNTITVQPGQDIRAEAMVYTTRVAHARAVLEVSLSDARGEVIPGTRRRTALIGGPSDNDRWIQVGVTVPGRFASVRYANLSVFLLQPARWRQLDANLRDQPSLIEYVDVHAKAWFDDITLYRLPRVTMTTGHPGQLVPADTQPEVQITVAGFANQPLDAELTVRDMAGKLVACQTFDSPGSERPDRTIQWRGGELPAGVYRTELSLYAGGGKLAGLPPLLTRQITFARLAAMRARSGSDRGFGLVLGGPPAGLDEPVARALADDQAGAIAQLPVCMVKVPMWHAGNASDPLDHADPWTDQIIKRLSSQRIGLVGVFGQAPIALQNSVPASEPNSARVARRRSLVDILSADSAIWRPYIAPQLARHAETIHYWQIGQENEEAFAQDSRFAPAIATVSKEVRNLLNVPAIVVAWPAMYSYKAAQENTGGQAASGTGENRADPEVATPPPPFPAPTASLFLSNRLAIDSLAEHMAQLAELTTRRPWATVEPPDEHAMEREARLAELAWRLVIASAGLAEPAPPAKVRGTQSPGNVFLPAPWVVPDVTRAEQVEPTEDLLVFRTVADLLAGCRFGGQITLADGVVGCIFDRGDGTGAMAVLNTSGKPVVPITMYLGEKVSRVDLFGNREPVEPPGADNTQLVNAGKAPFFLDGIDPRIARLRVSFRMDPPFVPSVYRKHVRKVQFVNTFDGPISGKLTLRFPDDWDVTPKVIPFSAQAGETFTREIEIRFPYNAQAGMKQYAADFQIDADRAYSVQLNSQFEFGLADVAVTPLTQWVNDDELMVTMNIVNRSDARLDMFCFVVIPDQPRQERVVAGLLPGGTTVKSFRITGAKALIGKSVRVGLREIRGNRIVNYDVPVK